MSNTSGTLKKELIRFALAGSCGFITDLVLTTLLKPYLGYYIARIPAFLTAVTVTWLINRTLTFKGKSNKHILVEYACYLGAMLIGGTVNYAVYALCISILQKNHYSFIPDKHIIFISIVAGTAAGTVLNFLASKYLIFNKKEQCEAIEKQ